MPPKPTRGGARKGAGRKKRSGSGRRVVTRGVSMPPEKWAVVDERRGAKSLGKWLAEII